MGSCGFGQTLVTVLKCFPAITVIADSIIIFIPYIKTTYKHFCLVLTAFNHPKHHVFLLLSLVTMNTT